MNSSVKFFEPIVIAGLDPLDGLLWITLPEAPEPVVVAAAPALPLVVVLFLSLLPQAARPRARANASSARTLRERMWGFLLDGVVVFWESLRPRGVTARCS